MSFWRVEVRKGRKRSWWATVVQADEATCRAAFAKTCERVPGKHLRLLDGDGQEVARHAPICWRTPYRGTGDLRCEKKPGHKGIHEAEGMAWTTCNGPAHGEPRP